MKPTNTGSSGKNKIYTLSHFSNEVKLEIFSRIGSLIDFVHLGSTCKAFRACVIPGIQQQFYTLEKQIKVLQPSLSKELDTLHAKVAQCTTIVSKGGNQHLLPGLINILSKIKPSSLKQLTPKGNLFSFAKRTAIGAQGYDMSDRPFFLSLCLRHTDHAYTLAQNREPSSTQERMLLLVQTVNWVYFGKSIIIEELKNVKHLTRDEIQTFLEHAKQSMPKDRSAGLDKIFNQIKARAAGNAAEQFSLMLSQLLG